MSNKTTFDNIIGNQEILLYDNTEVLSKQLGGEITSSPFLLIGLFLLAIITFFFFYFIYPENAKPFTFYHSMFYNDSISNKNIKEIPILSKSSTGRYVEKSVKNKEDKSDFMDVLQEAVKHFHEWILNKSTQFFTYLHIDGQTIKKVIV